MANQIKQPYVGVSGVISPEIEASLESIAAECGLHDKKAELVKFIESKK